MARCGRSSKNKKGSIQDILFVMIVLIFLSIVILIGFKVSNQINDNIQASSTFEAEGKAAASTLVGHYSGVIDKSFLLLTMGLGILILALAALVRVHPVFIPIYFIGLIFFIFLSGAFSNIYTAMAESPAFAAEAAQLVVITKVLTFLPWIVGMFGTLLMIIMYKNYSEAGGGV